MSKTHNSGAGRPTVYKKEFAAWAEKLCKLGATDPELAEAFEVSPRTIANWKIEHPEFMQAIRAGKVLADAEVASKLFHRATGYEHPEDDIRVVNGQIVITPTVKHYPPDSTAALFWLKNRRQDKWRELKAVELTGANGGPVETKTTFDASKLSSSTLEELLSLRDESDK